MVDFRESGSKPAPSKAEFRRATEVRGRVECRDFQTRRYVGPDVKPRMDPVASEQQ